MAQSDRNTLHLKLIDALKKDYWQNILFSYQNQIEYFVMLDDHFEIINLVDQNGQTSLHFFVSHYNYTYVDKLLDLGASIHIENKEGMNVIQLCEYLASENYLSTHVISHARSSIEKEINYIYKRLIEVEKNQLEASLARIDEKNDKKQNNKI